ncbi:MAG: D-isomer specific 2-hydroxyacid dehydrogenase family protein [Pseudomonadota bacterium]|nr:D-isomer specific 2-hydroxyacid dehydrogenase family protein [Pseudomonadota bacterium]
MPKIVAEDDVIIRASQIILDPKTDPERYAAIADYYLVDVPDFDGWINNIRKSVCGLFPARFEMLKSIHAYHAALSDADGIICESLPVGERELEMSPALKVVQKFGTDTRNIDLEACARRDVTVKTLKRRVNIAVAEHAFTMMLAMAKKLCLINHRIDEQSLRDIGFAPRMHDRRHAAAANWGRVDGLKTLYGSTVGCIGLGEIGREVASRATAFGANVLYYQRNQLPKEIEKRLNATYCSFEDLLKCSEYVSVHLPLNDSTRGIVDSEAFGFMKDGAFLINISRAAVIDRPALMDVLESDRLGGIALDVHYEEPSPADEPLRNYPKTILTPHSAVAGRDNATADMEELIGNLAAVIG